LRIGTHIFLQTTVLVLTGGVMTYVVRGQLEAAMAARDRVESSARDLESLERLYAGTEHFLLVGDLVLGGGTTYLALVAEKQADDMAKLIAELASTQLGEQENEVCSRLLEGTESMGAMVAQSLTLRGEDRGQSMLELLERFDSISWGVTEDLGLLREAMEISARSRGEEAEARLAQAESLTVRALLAFLTIILLSWSYLRRVLDRPIIRLAAQAEAARSGGIYVAPHGGPAEVQALSAGFAELVEGLEHARDGLEETVEERTAELQAALRARSLFLANTSHELRTPMNAILGFANVLTDDQLSAKERRENLGHIQDSGEHLMELISDLLDITSIDAGELRVVNEPFAPQVILDELRMGFAEDARAKSLRLEVGASEGLPSQLLGDGKAVSRILGILLDNAIKFTDKGHVELLLAYEKGRFVATVTDTGIGLAEADFERIFNAFEQGDDSHARKFRGSGLGLTIGRELARVMHGDLTVRSVLGEGCCFRLNLPLDAHEEPNLRPHLDTPGAALPTPKPGIRILVVDDVKLNRALAVRILQKMQVIVGEAHDGGSAIEAVQAAAAAGLPFDAILMDLQMPGIDGYEATERITAMGFEGPIIALSAAVMPEQQAHALRSGCAEFLAKPIDLMALCTSLARVGLTHG
jgi:signal transduction histidine kinase/ActR/RegA family two-component response regulator